MLAVRHDDDDDDDDNLTSSFEQISEAAYHKMAYVQPLTTHLTKHSD